MTIAELKSFYGLPEKILSEYFSEFLVNTPGTAEFAAASKEWDVKTFLSWSWQGGSQDAPASFSVTAFNPPPAFLITQTEKKSWMLERTSGSDLAYYEVNFSGNIDSRIGRFGVQFYPVKIYDEPWQHGLRYRAYQGHIDAWVNRTSFQGLSALVAQFENGLEIPYDIQRVKAALAYVNAAAKFRTELQVTKDLAVQRSNSEMNKFSSDLADRLRRDSADLSQKKFALLVAIDNEKKSAVRDMQNLLLNVQALRLK